MRTAAMVTEPPPPISRCCHHVRPQQLHLNSNSSPCHRPHRTFCSISTTITIRHHRHTKTIRCLPAIASASTTTQLSAPTLCSFSSSSSSSICRCQRQHRKANITTISPTTHYNSINMRPTLRTITASNYNTISSLTSIIPISTTNNTR